MIRAGLLLFACAALAFPETAVTSPDGRLSIEFHTTAAGGGQLAYSVTFQGKTLLEPSALRLNLKGQPPLGQNVRISDSVSWKADAIYHLVAGKAGQVRDHYNALRVSLEEPAAPFRKLTIEARAYDDAVAFRYIVPEQAALREFRLEQEGTEFRFSHDPFIRALLLPSYRTMYEGEYVKLSVSSVNKEALVGLPLLAEIPGVGWMAIMEADLRGYTSMYLTNPAPGWGSQRLESRLAPHIDDPAIAVTGGLPHQSAWRVVMAASDPGRLVESNVITSLNPETQIADTSWIRPGKASWDWWSGSLGADGKPAFTTANMKYYVDFAAESGFEYMLVDAGWSVPGDITKMNGAVDIPALTGYAASKGVKVWIWLRYAEAEKQMEEAFSLYVKWGVAGLKIDFVERDDQGGIDWYYRVAELAAKNHLMLDFHGATKPTGIERTYPNLLGYEAVLGMEYSKGGTRDNPDHQLTLPFTRMLAGPMDYTPGGFNNVTKADFVPRHEAPMVMGTRAHQLAMYAVFQAAFQMVSDSPAAYRDQPAFEFIKSVPASWDETKVLNGTPGEFITMARRHGNAWYLGAMTNWTPRDIDLSLDFLAPGSYRAEIYADAEDAGQLPRNVSVTKKTVDRTMHLKAHLAPAGGYAVRLVPIPAQ